MWTTSGCHLDNYSRLKLEIQELALGSKNRHAIRRRDAAEEGRHEEREAWYKKAGTEVKSATIAENPKIQVKSTEEEEDAPVIEEKTALEQEKKVAVQQGED